MTSIPKKSVALPAALLVAGSLLAGCANNMDLDPPGEGVDDGWHRFWAHGDWKQRPEPYKNQVERVQMEYAVGFDPGKAELGQDDLRKLHAFLREQKVSGSDSISVEGPIAVTGGRDALTTTRIARVVEELSRTGLQVAVAPADAATSTMDRDELLLTVSRHIVLSPECETDDPVVGDRPEFYWSCATTANLGAMVANPEDLARGRTPGPAEAEPAAAGVKRYRTGEITPLIDVTTGSN